MKYAVVVLGIVAVVVLTLGAFNRELVVDVDYVAGTWRSVNAFWVFAAVAAVVMAAGLLAVLFALAASWRVRGKLEKELLEVYRRLRAVEAELEGARAAMLGPSAAVTLPASAGRAAEARMPTPAEGVPVAPVTLERTQVTPAEAVTEAHPSPLGPGLVGEPSDATTAAEEPGDATTLVGERTDAATVPGEQADDSTTLTGSAAGEAGRDPDASREG